MSDKISKKRIEGLINRFSKSNVIFEMENEYKSNDSKNFLIALIDDNKFLKLATINSDILEKTGESLNKIGFSRPLIIRPSKGRYEVVLGRKNLLAAKKAHFESAPAIVKNLSDEEVLVMNLLDIVSQKSFNPIEVALVCKKLKKEYAFTHQGLADITGISRPQVTNLIRLLKLSDKLIQDVSTGKLSYGHAKCLVSLPENIVNDAVEAVYKKHLSVRQMEDFIQNKLFINYKETIDLLNKKYRSFISVKTKSVTFKFENDDLKHMFLNELLNNK